MDQMTQMIEGFANNYVYAWYAIPLLLVAAGLYLTYQTGFVQIRHFGTAVKMVFEGISKEKSKDSEGSITPFQALSTALASTVGNGNIGGVATAILVGGPGAIFWMWVTAAVGMATKFAEAVLGVHYRVTTESGELASGPMYYITNGLKGKGFARPLAYMFCLFGAATALLGTGNMAQSNTIAQTFMQAATQMGHSVSAWVPGTLITVACGLVLLGGIKRIAAVAEKLVPSMIVLYVVVGVAYIVINAGEIPHVFALILGNAFTPTAAMGGFAGASLRAGLAAGVSRGVLSNEAGLGSAPIAHGIAKVKHPVEQGVVGVFEVFTDTIVVCSMTAFIILSSGLWTNTEFQNASGDLTAAALQTTVPGASLVVAVCSFLFGFSTLIGWYYYGEKCFEYMFGAKGILPYRVIYTILIYVGAVVPVPLVWAIGTLLNGFMAFPNLIALIMLGGVVGKLTKEFFSQKKAAA